MNKTIIGIIIAIIVVGGVIAVAVTGGKDKPPATTSQTSALHDEPQQAASSNSTNQQSQTPENTSNVTIHDYSFGPQTITVKAGTKVTWTNQDSVGHDVAPDEDYGDAFARSDGLLSKGESYSFTFTKPGTYTYHCTPHPYMQATVMVTE